MRKKDIKRIKSLHDSSLPEPDGGME